MALSLETANIRHACFVLYDRFTFSGSSNNESFLVIGPLRINSSCTNLLSDYSINVCVKNSETQALLSTRKNRIRMYTK